jgi:hypothetical protein
MESATFRKWLAEQGCRFDRPEQKRGGGHAVARPNEGDVRTRPDGLRRTPKMMVLQLWRDEDGRKGTSARDDSGARPTD